MRLFSRNVPSCDLICGDIYRKWAGESFLSSKDMKIMTGEQFYSVQNTPTVLLNLRLGLKE